MLMEVEVVLIVVEALVEVVELLVVVVEVINSAHSVDKPITMLKIVGKRMAILHIFKLMELQIIVLTLMGMKKTPKQSIMKRIIMIQKLGNSPSLQLNTKHC
jgi:hypothetical protein